jgi:hypothetical protein
MKRQEILEIIVSNPQAIFRNGNTVAGKYSEYPSRFQVVGTAHDKSYVHVKSVSVSCTDYLLKEDGQWLRDENGHVVKDERPLAERVSIEHGRVKTMPTRLVLKSELTEASMVTDYITTETTKDQERTEREVRLAKAEVEVNELQEVFVALGITDTGGSGANALSWYGRITLQFDFENITRLVSALKSALVEVGV